MVYQRFLLWLVFLTLLSGTAWGKSLTFNSVVFLPAQQILWLESKDAATNTVIYVSPKNTKVVKGNAGTDTTAKAVAALTKTASDIFSAWGEANKILLQSQNSYPLAEQQALWDVTVKQLVGVEGLQLLRSIKFAQAAQPKASASLTAAISEGGNGGNEDHPIPASIAEGGNGGNEDHPIPAQIAEGGNGGNEDHPKPVESAIQSRKLAIPGTMGQTALKSTAILQHSAPTALPQTSPTGTDPALNSGRPGKKP